MGRAHMMRYLIAVVPCFVLAAPIVWVLVRPLMPGLVPSLLAVVGMLAVITVWSSLLPARGLADRLSGTCPVPR